MLNPKMTVANYKKFGCPYIDDYREKILSEEVPASKELKLAMVLIENKLDDPDVFIDTDKTEKAIELIEKYFKMTLLDWELFIMALIHCYYVSLDSVVFDEFFIMMGRGNGKNGFISGLTWYLTTENHGVKGYNVDIIANSEDQAKVSFNDIYEMLEDNWNKLSNFFIKTKEVITSTRTRSEILYNTSNARTKDGKRSACLVFDEKHEYENSKLIGVFKSGFGKRKHSRIFTITTNGYVRDGVLDEDLRMANDVLTGAITGLGLCPLIYKMDNDEECDNPHLWTKANPSLPYFPELKKQMDKEFIEKEYNLQTKLDFYTKRMNLPRTDMEEHITDWENVIATNKPLIDLSGKDCTCGIDYAMINDWASVNLHFVVDGIKYDINHSWLCKQSTELHRIKAPWEQWAEDGLLTVVDDVEINPSLLMDWIEEKATEYNITKVFLDHFRLSLLKSFLRDIGFDTVNNKNLVQIRPSDVMRLVPVISSDFLNQRFIWGDNPVLRWATFNTKLERRGKKEGVDTGNYYYAKIEGKSRKTDPFMALVASMVGEDDLIIEGSEWELAPEINL